jgi:hypothetical protein
MVRYDKNLLRGREIGDWVILYGMNMCNMGMGKIIGIDESKTSVVMKRPTRYSMGPDGFRKGPGTLEFSVDLPAILNITDTSEEEIWGYLDPMPHVENLGNLVEVGGNGSKWLGVIRNAYAGSMVLNPFMYSGPSDKFEKNEKNLVIQYQPSMVIIPQEGSIDDFIADLNSRKEGQSASGSAEELAPLDQQ